MADAVLMIFAIAIGVGVWCFLIWVIKDVDIKNKKEDKILSALSESKKQSLSLISSSSGVKHAEVIEILREFIEDANSLSTKKKSSDEDLEKYRFLRNARIDLKKDEIILDENATEIITRFDKISNAINVLRGHQPKKPQSEPPKDWNCSFCGSVNNGVRDKCLNCGAPAN